NRDRNLALLDLQRDVEAYRPYLALSPDQARERAKSAPPAEKRRLETLSGLGWGPIHMYFQLTPQQQAALRAGQTLKFGQQPEAGEEPLAAEIARGVLETRRALPRPQRQSGPGRAEEIERQTGPEPGEGSPDADPMARRIVEDPDGRAMLTLRLSQS